MESLGPPVKRLSPVETILRRPLGHFASQDLLYGDFSISSPTVISEKKTNLSFEKRP